MFSTYMSLIAHLYMYPIHIQCIVLQCLYFSVIDMQVCEVFYDTSSNITTCTPSGVVLNAEFSYINAVPLPGHNCENDVDECEVRRPCVNGICENTNGSYQCYCRPGFSGDHCNLEFDECLSRPCHNAGTCINEINGYSCLCAPGYTGVDCDVDIDECESSPCQNNATCHDHIAAFTCECRPGFTDELCATNIDECEVCLIFGSISFILIDIGLI